MVTDAAAAAYAPRRVAPAWRGATAPLRPRGGQRRSRAGRVPTPRSATLDCKHVSNMSWRDVVGTACWRMRQIRPAGGRTASRRRSAWPPRSSSRSPGYRRPPRQVSPARNGGNPPIELAIARISCYLRSSLDALPCWRLGFSRTARPAAKEDAADLSLVGDSSPVSGCKQLDELAVGIRSQRPRARGARHAGAGPAGPASLIAASSGG